MNIKFLEYLGCPSCYGNLVLQSGSIEKNVLNDKLECKACEIKYPIIDGIPRFIDKLGMMETTKNTFSERVAVSL